jgi:hypothetical protein
MMLPFISIASKINIGDEEVDEYVKNTSITRVCFRIIRRIMLIY